MWDFSGPYGKGGFWWVKVGYWLLVTLKRNCAGDPCTLLLRIEAFIFGAFTMYRALGFGCRVSGFRLWVKGLGSRV